MTEKLVLELLIALTSGWSGFLFYWFLFLAVALFELLRPSRRPRIAGGDRITVNFGLGFFVAVLQMVPLFTTYVGALLAEEHGFGVLRLLDLPFWASVVVSFLLLDLAGYIFHRASHEVPLLWRLHRVHHSDRTVDASTTFRSHPLSVIVFIGFDFAVIYVLGVQPVGVLAYAVCKLLTMWLSHADITSAPRISALLATLFVTPAFHHRHHSAEQVYTDSNYGEVLTIWDRLFGTTSALDGDVERYGLGDDYDRDAASLSGQLKLPFKPL